MDDDRETEVAKWDVRYCACAVWFVEVPRCRRAALRTLGAQAHTWSAQDFD